LSGNQDAHISRRSSDAFGACKYAADVRCVGLYDRCSSWAVETTQMRRKRIDCRSTTAYRRSAQCF